jgi:hypothetical protein
LKVYEEKTGKDLSSDPLLHRIETCHSPDDIITILRQQIPRSYKSQSGDDKLTRWLNPTVSVIKAVSANIGGAVALVSPTQSEVCSSATCALTFIMKSYPPSVIIFTAIGVLFSV